MAKRIAVIGSGASGIAAIKTCLEEGLEPVCYERTNRIGGLWHYTEEVTDGQGCVMKSTVINTSKECMSYSDYPVPTDYPMFMHNTYVLKYLQSYAEYFGSDKYIRFNHEVLCVKQTADHQETGQWLLTVKDKGKDITSTELFDAVFVCTGHHADTQMAYFKGMEHFKGEILHAHDYRHHVGYENKKVVIVGIGNSAGDIAVELSRIASQVYISTRRGSWVFHRIAENGYPIDLSYIRRVNELLKSFIPTPVLLKIVERRLNSRFDHANYGLKPKHSVLSQHATVNDDLPNRIACGMIKIRPNIQKISSTSVEFNDGRIEEDIDVIILATGYKFGFPFIDHPALKVYNNVVNLYKYVFPPDIRPSTLAIIGCIQPLGAIMPVSEIQCRWAIQVFKGEVQLPRRDVLWRDIHQKRETMKKRYVSSPRHTIQADYIEVMDEIGDLAGCRPDLFRLFWKDPALALRCYFGSFVPYQYRLMGPHTWPGARQAIMTVRDRTLAPTLPASVETRVKSTPAVVYVLAFVILAIIIRWISSILVG